MRRLDSLETAKEEAFKKALDRNRPSGVPKQI
jgi:hypothetical protein